MIGNMVGAMLGAGPTMLGPGRAPTTDGLVPRRRARRRKKDDLKADEEEALILLSLALASKRR